MLLEEGRQSARIGTHLTHALAEIHNGLVHLGRFHARQLGGVAVFLQRVGGDSDSIGCLGYLVGGLNGGLAEAGNRNHPGHAEGTHQCPLERKNRLLDGRKTARDGAERPLSLVLRVDVKLQLFRHLFSLTSR